MLTYYKNLSPLWLCALFFGFLIGCVNTPYTRKAPSHELCQNAPSVSKAHGKRYLTPCLTGELAGRRLFLSQGDGVFSYRYDGLKGQMTGLMRAVQVRPSDAQAQRTQWRFAEVENGKTIATFDVERKACQFKHVPFKLTFTLTLPSGTFSGCGYQIQP